MIGFVVEGSSDKKVIEEICKKIHVKPEIRHKRPGGGISPRKTESYAKDLLYKKSCKKVIILKDSHCSDPAEVERKTRDKIKFNENVKICIVVHAIESWLLADEEAIGDYLSSKIKEIHNPENACKPEEVLGGIFKKNGREYLKGGEDPREIAKRLRLEKVIKKCPSFIKFKQFIIKE